MKPHRVLVVALFIAALLFGTRVGVDASSLSQAASISYTVRQGDTLSGIAQRFGSTVKAIQQANGLAGSTIYPGQMLTVPSSGGAASSASSGQSQALVVASSGSVTHLVRSGDTLSSIAAHYGTTVQALKLANGLTSDTILVGQTLTVPPASGRMMAVTPSDISTKGASAAASCANPYTVRAGDTLSAIAARCGVALSDLRSSNSLSNRSVLRPGQSLRIPVEEAQNTSSSYGAPPALATPTPTRVPARPPSVYSRTTP